MESNDGESRLRRCISILFSAGLLTYSTKSGTNAFHGDAFEYLYLNTPGFQDFGRNPFTENTPIGGHAGAFSPTTHQNQFGGSIGGRIIKDKLFFFGDAQLTRNLKGGSVSRRRRPPGAARRLALAGRSGAGRRPARAGQASRRRLVRAARRAASAWRTPARWRCATPTTRTARSPTWPASRTRPATSAD